LTVLPFNYFPYMVIFPISLESMIRLLQNTDEENDTTKIFLLLNLKDQWR